MKNILLTSIILMSLISCKAQTIIVPIFSTENIEKNPNYYLKDVNNDFDKFEGTWSYFDLSTNTEFTIELKKELHYLSPSNYYKDLIIGEYYYKKNGAIIMNTMSDIDNPSISTGNHNISGYSILNKNNTPFCDTCDITERRVQLLIRHTIEADVMGYLTLRHIMDNGIEKLEARISNASIMGHSQTSYEEMPFGEFVFVKQ